MMRRIARELAGLSIVAFMLSALLAFVVTSDGMLTWELPVLYQFTACMALLGLWGLASMIATAYRSSRIKRPNLITVTAFLFALTQQKIFMFIFWQAVAIITFLNNAPHMANGRILAGPVEQALFTILLGSAVAQSFVNILLFTHRHHTLEEMVDLVPFRGFFVWIRRRARGR